MISAAQIDALLVAEFPQILIGGRAHTILSVTAEEVVLALEAGTRHLRPGGTVSGPALMELADLALYVAVLAARGPVTLAVTTSLTINFLRKPAPGRIEARCRLFKLGKRLAVGEVAIAGVDGALVAHATGTYSLPDA